jgi:hypothetical protein
MYNPYYFMPLPFLPLNCSKPPTMQVVLRSIIPDKTVKAKDLAKEGRNLIFDFEYPLSDHISKENFEMLILNHYMMRRIGYETVTAFQIALNSKLNEIMPFYNKMFDSLSNWDIFEGETIERIGQEKNKGENSLENESNTENSNIQDRRYSDTPQNRLEDVRDGSYVTEYNYDTANANSKDKSNSKGTSKNDRDYNEKIIKTSPNKIEILKQMQSDIKSIYTLIFKDLDDLFYGLL